MFVLPADNEDLRFPPVDLASPEGLLAIGGDLRSERLLQAYRAGIFPWYNEGQPILWWSPDPRAVLYPKQLKLTRSLKKTLRQGKFRITLDQAFSQVMQACAAPRARRPEEGTWITQDMLTAYKRLHQQGYAHSVEAWCEQELVGGLYGVALGKVFFGESMFSRATDASKVAFAHLVRQLRDWGFCLIDCQVSSTHLISLGAQEIRRQRFMQELEQALHAPGQTVPWRLDPDLDFTD